MASRKIKVKVSKMIRNAGPLIGSGMGRKTEKAVGYFGKGRKWQTIARAVSNDKVRNYLDSSRYKGKNKKNPTVRAGRMKAAFDIKAARNI